MIYLSPIHHKYLFAFHLTKSRNESSAFTLINQAAKLLSTTNHIAVKPMSSDITNNLIRPHGSLDNSTPNEVAGFTPNFSNKCSWFIAT